MWVIPEAQRANTAVTAEVNGPATVRKFPFPWPVRSTTSRSGEVPSTGRSSSSPSSADAPTASTKPTHGPHRRTHRRPGHQQPPPPCAAGGQFSLGKSRQAYGPMGMWVVTPDVLADLDDLVIGCAADGEKTQDPTPATSSSVSSFSASLVAEVSGVFPLLPGDLGFTGSLRGRHNSASHRASSRPAARSLNPGSRSSVRSATVAVEPHAVADTPRPSPRWELSIPALDGETACHNQPTRRKFQRSRSTAMIMMRIASG